MTALAAAAAGGTYGAAWEAIVGRVGPRRPPRIIGRRRRREAAQRAERHQRPPFPRFSAETLQF